MSTSVANEIYTVFDARRVKAPELKNIDHGVNWLVGYVKNRTPILGSLRKRAIAVGKLEEEIKKLGSTAFREKVLELKDLGRIGKLKGDSPERTIEKDFPPEVEKIEARLRQSGAPRLAPRSPEAQSHSVAYCSGASLAPTRSRAAATDTLPPWCRNGFCNASPVTR